MIQIYDIGNENYDRNGNAVLTPTAGRVTMQAGGACDISLTLPMDPDGKWRHVVPGAVVKYNKLQECWVARRRFLILYRWLLEQGKPVLFSGKRRSWPGRWKRRESRSGGA